MVLVRKSELACRNFMDQALWEPAEDPQEFAELPDTLVPEPSVVAGDLAPDIAMEASTLARKSPAKNSDHTDQITSIAMDLNAGPKPADRPPRHVSFGADRLGSPSPESGSVVRDAQRRRQEEQERRKRMSEGLLPDAPRLLDQLTQPQPEASVRHAGESPIGDATVRPTPRFVLPQDDLDEEPVVPRQRGPERPPLVAPPTHRSKREPVISFQGDGSVAESALMPPRTPEPSLPVAELPSGHTEPYQTLATPPSVGGNAPLGRARRGDDQSHTAQPQPSIDTGVRARRATSGDDVFVTRRDSSHHLEPRSDQHVMRTPAPALPLPLAIDPIDADQALVGLRRCCGNCRDFQPEGDGLRGRCRNAYAFAKQRMVKSDELACRSSIGVWWLPRDDLWLERADMLAATRSDQISSGFMQSLAAERTGAGSQRRGEL